MHTLSTSIGFSPRALARGTLAHRTTLTVLMLLLAGWGAWLYGRKAPRAATPILSQAPVELWATIEPPATFSVSDGEHAISVCDPNGAPLAGVELWQTVPRARWLDATHSTRLATTDHTGLACAGPSHGGPPVRRGRLDRARHAATRDALPDPMSTRGRQPRHRRPRRGRTGEHADVRRRSRLRARRG